MLSKGNPIADTKEILAGLRKYVTDQGAILEVKGFTTLPVGTRGLDATAVWNVVAWGSQLFEGALRVALPGMTALLVVNLAFGVMSRAAPTLNLFAVGFPVTLIAGLVIVYAGLPSVQTSFVESLDGAFDLLRALSRID